LLASNVVGWSVWKLTDRYVAAHNCLF